MIKNFILATLTALTPITAYNNIDSQQQESKFSNTQNTQETTDNKTIEITYSQKQSKYTSSSTSGDLEKYLYTNKYKGTNNDSNIMVRSTNYTTNYMQTRKYADNDYTIKFDTDKDRVIDSTTLTQIETYKGTDNSKINIKNKFLFSGVVNPTDTFIVTFAVDTYIIYNDRISNFLDYDISNGKTAYELYGEIIENAYDIQRLESRTVQMYVNNENATFETITPINVIPNNTTYILNKISNSNKIDPSKFVKHLTWGHDYNTEPGPTIINYNLTSGNITYDVIDLPGLIFTILTIPFAFCSQAFDVTIFPHTPYQLNIGHLVVTIIAIFVLVFILKLIIGNFKK